MLMCIKNLVKFCPMVLKILCGNEMVTDLRNYGMTEGQGKSNIAPLFQSGAIMTERQNDGQAENSIPH